MDGIAPQGHEGVAVNNNNDDVIVCYNTKDFNNDEIEAQMISRTQPTERVVSPLLVQQPPPKQQSTSSIPVHTPASDEPSQTMRATTTTTTMPQDIRTPPQAVADDVEQAASRPMEGDREHKLVRKRNLRLVLLTVMGVIIVCSVVVASLYTTRRTSSTTPLTDVASSVSPTYPPTTSTDPPITMFSMGDILELLGETTDVSHVLSHPNSAEYRAVEWLTRQNKEDAAASHNLVQRYAFATFYFATGGDNGDGSDGNNGNDDNFDDSYWVRDNRWLSHTLPICIWWGVGCTVPPNGNEKIVTSLNLDSNALNGTLPTTLGLLTSLQYLSLGDNSLRGTLPTEISLLPNLVALSLRNNSLTGSIPQEFGSMTSLTQLNLDVNSLSGSLPRLSTSLVELWLDGNFLTGTLPAQLPMSLEILTLWGNQLTGVLLPIELGLMTNLALLDLGENSFSGTLPSQVGLMKSLNELWLDFNVLSGILPNEFVLMTSLQGLSLHGNELTGTIPTQIGLMTNLLWLNLGQNAFSGTLPIQFGRMEGLIEIWLYDNELTGKIPTEISLMTSLVILDLGDNAFSGTVPTEMGSMAGLESLWLSNNTDLKGDVNPLFCDVADNYETIHTKFTSLEELFMPTLVTCDCCE